MRAGLLPTALTLLVVSACPWRGVGDLIDDATVEVVVTGLLPGDELALTIDDDTTRLVADDARAGRLSLFETLPPGEHEGLLELVRGDERRCHELEFTTRAGERTSVAVDTGTFEPCDDDDEDDEDEEEDAGPEDDAEDAGPEEDAGVLAPVLDRLRETDRDETCTPEPCEVETRIEEGRVDVNDADGEREGELPAALWLDIQTLALSTQANALFAGDDPACPVSSPPADLSVELERRVETAEDESTRVTERLDVVGCDGVAAQLRALIADARTYATEVSTEDPDDAGPEEDAGP
jgi:hypothetical protein